MSDTEFTIRRLEPSDSLTELTALLHAAYAKHLAAGLRFFASYQSAEDTRHRVSKGDCWIALDRGNVVGTVTIAMPHIPPHGYPTRPGCGTFYQMAVLPSYTGRGLGSVLLRLAEQRIKALGGNGVVIDTSSLATELIEWYAKRGYNPIGLWQWGVTNYDSIVLFKDLA
jgi:GNAT superfamily N-acetyltransferase